MQVLKYDKYGHTPLYHTDLNEINTIKLLTSISIDMRIYLPKKVIIHPGLAR